MEDSYSYSKLAGEILLESFSSAYGMRTHTLRSAGICNEECRRNAAKNAGPVTGWSSWMWPWVGSEDIAAAHRLLMEKAHSIAPNGVYFCNADDTMALEPSREIVERFNPELLPLIKDLKGHDSFMSNRKLKETVGWEHKTSWRRFLPEGESK